MTTLTSVQEAAFNAAGEAALGLEIPGGRSYDSRLVLFFYPDGVSAGCQKPNGMSGGLYAWKKPTAAEAVSDLLRLLEVERNKPPLLETAAQAVEAIRPIVENAYDRDEMLSQIEKLPVA